MSEETLELPKGLRIFLYFTAAMTGAGILIVEILGAKMLSPFLGTFSVPKVEETKLKDNDAPEQQGEEHQRRVYVVRRKIPRAFWGRKHVPNAQREDVQEKAQGLLQPFRDADQRKTREGEP